MKEERPLVFSFGLQYRIKSWEGKESRGFQCRLFGNTKGRKAGKGKNGGKSAQLQQLRKAGKRKALKEQNERDPVSRMKGEKNRTGGSSKESRRSGGPTTLSEKGGGRKRATTCAQKGQQVLAKR